MTKKIIQKSLFNHYPQANSNKQQNQETKESSKEEFNNSRNQEILNSRTNKKEDWKKVNFRIKESLHSDLKIYAVKNNIRLEDLFNDIIEEYLNKRGAN